MASAASHFVSGAWQAIGKGLRANVGGRRGGIPPRLTLANGGRTSQVVGPGRVAFEIHSPAELTYAQIARDFVTRDLFGIFRYAKAKPNAPYQHNSTSPTAGLGRTLRHSSTSFSTPGLGRGSTRLQRPVHQVGLGQARNFSSGQGQRLFENLIQNVPIGLRAIGNEGLDEKKWRAWRKRHEAKVTKQRVEQEQQERTKLWAEAAKVQTIKDMDMYLPRVQVREPVKMIVSLEDLSFASSTSTFETELEEGESVLSPQFFARLQQQQQTSQRLFHKLNALNNAISRNDLKATKAQLKYLTWEGVYQIWIQFAWSPNRKKELERAIGDIRGIKIEIFDPSESTPSTSVAADAFHPDTLEDSLVFSDHSPPAFSSPGQKEAESYFEDEEEWQNDDQSLHDQVAGTFVMPSLQFASSSHFSSVPSTPPSTPSQARRSDAFVSIMELASSSSQSVSPSNSVASERYREELMDFILDVQQAQSFQRH